MRCVTMIVTTPEPMASPWDSATGRLIELPLLLDAEHLVALSVPHRLHYLAAFGPLLAVLVTALLGGRAELRGLLSSVFHWRIWDPLAGDRRWLAARPLRGLDQRALTSLGSVGAALDQLRHIDDSIERHCIGIINPLHRRSDRSEACQNECAALGIVTAGYAVPTSDRLVSQLPIEG